MLATYLHHLECSKCKPPPNHDLTLLTHVQHTHLRHPRFLILLEDPIASYHPETISWGFLLLAKFPPGICNWQDPPDSCQFPVHIPLPVYVSKPVLLFLLPLLFGIVVFWKCFPVISSSDVLEKERWSVYYTHTRTTYTRRGVRTIRRPFSLTGLENWWKMHSLVFFHPVLSEAERLCYNSRKALG